MKLNQKTQILSSWCATSPIYAQKYFPNLVAATPKDNDNVWHTLLETLQAPKLVRMLTIMRSQNAPERQELGLNRLTFTNGQVLWDGQRIGQITTYYKTVMPYEAQAKVAYELLFDHLEIYIAEKYKVVILQHNISMMQLFIPDGQEFELGVVWQKFIKKSFSLDALKMSFAPLVNTIKMTERGFSALDVPLVSQEQAQFLAAFYVVNLESLQRGDTKREREITELEKELEGASSKDRKRLEKKIVKIERELQSRYNRYEPLYEKVKRLRLEYPVWMEQVDAMRTIFRPIAGTQIAKATAKISKCITNIEIYTKLDEVDFYQIPSLLAPLSTIITVRTAGDDNTKVCYACGQGFEKKANTYNANKFIFESPSQRLQSGGSQTQPKVCGVCAAISFISPIKLGNGRLVVRMKERGEGHVDYLANEQLQMFVLGEMNLVAGKYVMLQANETVGGNKPIFNSLGGLQYALYKVGTSFETDVFEQYNLEVLLDGNNLPLTGRHLVWLNWLDKVFAFQRKDWKDKAQFAAFGRAIRYIQKEEVLFAIYELLKSGLVYLPLSTVNGNQLEHLRKEHIRWLDMDKKSEKAQFFKDIAAMTGLLYAFCSYVRSEVKKVGGNERIEVRKAIERSGDPYQFDYTVADNTHSEMATLYRQADMYFSYDQLKVFLPDLGVDITARETTDEKNQLRLRLYFDDVVNAYTHLYETRYKTAKEQRDFSYQLKLSLHARFPELIEATKKENE